jgi:NitT/TauT family transport system substrate-binding protein
VRTRRASILTVAVALLVALGACSRADSNNNAGANPAPATDQGPAAELRLGYFPNVTHAAALIGLEKGLFTKELGNTKLTPTSFNAGPDEVSALLGNSLDIGFIGSGPTINAFAKSKGEAVRLIAGATSGGAQLVARNDITKPEDLVGKTVVTPQLGNTQDVALLNYLAGKGYQEDPQTGKGDVTVTRIDNKTTVTAFQQGQIDGAWVPEPTASQLVAAGAKTLIDEKSLWPNRQFVTTNVVVSQSFLTAHPDVVEAVLRGSVQANAWIKANPQAAKSAINAQLQALNGKPLPAKVLDAAFGNIEVADDPLAATLQQEAAHGVAAGLLKQPDLKGIYDLTPLNAVLKSQGRPQVSDAGLGS